jgi:hypothetical protein
MLPKKKGKQPSLTDNQNQHTQKGGKIASFFALGTSLLTAALTFLSAAAYQPVQRKRRRKDHKQQE